MTITNPNIVLYFIGDDLVSGNSTTQTISSEYIINNSIVFRYQLLNELKSSSNQVTLQLSKDCPSIEDIIATDGDISIVLKDEDTVLFTGYISTNFSWTLTHSGEQALNITIEDKSTRLLSRCFISSGSHLFDCTATEAIEAVCEVCGLTISSSAITISDEITKVVDSSVTCKTILDEMLYELGYVYYCDEYGELNFFKIDCESVDNITVLDKDSLYVSNGSAIQLSKKIRQYRSVRISFVELGTATDYLVYRNTTGQDADNPFCNLELEAGEHFDGLEIYSEEDWAEETADAYREDALVEACNAASETSIVGSNTIISVSDIAIKVEKGSDITATIEAAGGPYLKIDAENAGSSTEAITRLDAYGSILYEKSTEIIRTSEGSDTTDSLFSGELSYVHTRSLASRHANLLCQYHAYCNSQYTFYSATDLNCGDIVNLHDNLHTGLNVNVLIVSKAVTYGDVNKYTAVGISVFDLDKDTYHRASDTSKADTKGSSSRWYNGSLLYGQTYARGAAGNKGDYYYNTETGYTYVCISSGSSTTALWQYIGSIKGEDADLSSYSYEIEYGLSTSPTEFEFPDANFGYEDEDSEETDTFGSIEDSESFDYGFNDYVWSSSSTDGWYRGLYVWQRLKTTDSDGNITYGEPIYAEQLTLALMNGCIFNAVLTDADGDGSTATWEKNLADSSSTVSVIFKLIGRSYSDASAFQSALSALSISFYKSGSLVSTVDLSGSTPASTAYNSDTKLATLIYSTSFAKNSDYDSLVINATLTETFLDASGSEYVVDTDASTTMTSVDITEYDAFGGLFADTTEAEEYFTETYGGVAEGYTFAISDTSSSSYLALMTYTEEGWALLSGSGFTSARISAICAKAQKAVLASVEEGSVTASDYGYFNVIIANIITADYIGAQTIEVQSGGFIKGGSRYDDSGVIADWAEDGFWFGADGRLMANLQSDGNGNTYVGTGISQTSSETGEYNTAMGYQAMYSVVSGGSYNIAFGYRALYTNSTGDSNIAIGYLALYSNTASENIAIGSKVMYSNTSGVYNNALGYQALYSNTTGSYNMAIGYQSLYANATGDNNIAIGYMALYANTASDNVAIGNQALYSNTSGNYNIAIGYQALYNDTTDNYNIGIGYQALYSTKASGFNNLALGYKALYSNTYGTLNTAIGNNALLSNELGNSNTAVGNGSLRNNDSGAYNTAVGSTALYKNESGTSNIAIGSGALYWLTDGGHNVGIGSSANVYSPTGSYQMNLNNSLVYLEFSSSRTAGDIYTALHSYYSSSVGTRKVGCTGTINNDFAVGMEFRSDTIYIYGRDSTLATLTSGSSTTYSGRTMLLFLRPDIGGTARNDCLSI